MDLTNENYRRFPTGQTIGSSFPKIDFEKSHPPCMHNVLFLGLYVVPEFFFSQ